MAMSAKHISILAILTFILFYQSYQAQNAVSLFIARPKLQAKQYRYLTGQHQQHSKEIRQAINELMLKHLFTPSGVHYSSILKWLPKANLFQFLFILITTLLVLQTSHESLKRIGIMRLFNLHGLSRGVAYLLMMSIYALVFLSQHNLLSYLLSGIFLCIIIFGDSHRQKMFLIIVFSLIIQMSFDKTVTPIAPLLNLLMTAIYSLYFPLHLLSCGLDYLDLWSYPLIFFNQITDQLILSLQQVNLLFPTFIITPSVLIFLYCIYLRKILLTTLLALCLSNFTQFDSEKNFWKNKRLKIKNPPKGGSSKSKFL